jgi:hypothetical protein
MLRPFFFALFVLVVDLLGACNRQDPTDPPSVDANVEDATGDTTDADEEQPPDTPTDTAEPLDLDPAATDVPDSAPDAETDIVGDVADTADAKPPWKPDITGPSPYCEQQNVDLPMPGSPCTEEGKVRCTGAGAFDAPDTAEPSGLRCVKPNRVTCQKVGNALQWVLAACGPLNPGCDMYDPLDKYGNTGFYGAETMLCQENELGASCCPLDIADLTDPESPSLSARLCDPSANATMCQSKFIGLRHCQFLSEPFDSPTLEETKVTTYASCTDAAAKCRYWYYTKVCPYLYTKECAGLPPDGSGNPGPTAQVCIDLAEEPARCAETCQDLKKAGYPLPTK